MATVGQVIDDKYEVDTRMMLDGKICPRYILPWISA